ncbi:hypothetical protein TPA0906_12630 [Streptomyces olivaceus]|nr:hypothetical protein TPA0906_12630 [Streptomyces olivaceus]
MAGDYWPASRRSTTLTAVLHRRRPTGQQAAAQGDGLSGRDKLTQEQLDALRELGVEWA